MQNPVKCLPNSKIHVHREFNMAEIGDNCFCEGFFFFEVLYKHLWLQIVMKNPLHINGKTVTVY